MSPIGKLSVLTAHIAILIFVAFVVPASPQTESLEEVYKKALKEGGTLNFYGTLAQINAEKILPLSIEEVQANFRKHLEEYRTYFGK